MTIRISYDELTEFDGNLKTIKNNINELSMVMEQVTNKIVYERIVSDNTVVTEIEKLSQDIKELESELEKYIYDIDLIKQEFKDIDDKLKNDSIELKNMIQDLLNKTKNSFIPATYSISASISSDANESAMKIFGIEEKVNQTIELSKYNSYQ